MGLHRTRPLLQQISCTKVQMQSNRPVLLEDAVAEQMYGYSAAMKEHRKGRSNVSFHTVQCLWDDDQRWSVSCRVKVVKCRM